MFSDYTINFYLEHYPEIFGVEVEELEGLSEEKICNSIYDFRREEEAYYYDLEDLCSIH